MSHTILITGVSDETWRERADRMWQENGGAAIEVTPYNTLSPDIEAKLRANELADQARAYATNSMLNEIHLMLRLLVRRGMT